MKDVDKFITKIEQLRVYLREKFVWAQVKQEEHANKNRLSFLEFRVKNKVMLDARFQKITRSSKSLDYKNFDLFTIIKIVNKYAFLLDLSKTMKDVFSIFHSWLLHLDEGKSLNDQREKELDSINELEGSTWQVNEILDFKIDRRRRDFVTNQLKDCLRYKIKWIDH